MDSSSPRVGSRALPLTAENLRSVPRLGSSIAKFVAEQRQNARLYTPDVPKLTNPAGDAPKRVKDTTKTSPQLKSRLEIRQAREAEAAKQVNVAHKLKQASDPAKSVNTSNRNEILYGSRDIRGAEAAAPRKRRRIGDGDEEYEARLEERRERKRARKAILSPDAKRRNVELDSDAERSEDNAKRKKKKRTKGAPGMTLMETFTAANVKKSSRLTLPPLAGRMFKNAKAGSPIKLTDKENTRIGKMNDSNTVRKRHTERRMEGNGPKATRKETNASRSEEESIACDESLELSNAPTRSRTRESKSWALGSQLPEEDEQVGSVCTPSRKIPLDPEISSSPLSPIGVMKLPIHWNFTSKNANTGTFEHPTPISIPNTAQKDGEQNSQIFENPQGATTSPYFLRPLVQIPAHILYRDGHQEEAFRSPEELDQPEHDGMSLEEVGGERERVCQDQDPGAEPIVANFQEEIGHMEAEQVYDERFDLGGPSFTSLDLMLHQHDEEDDLYNLTFRIESQIMERRPRDTLTDAQMDGRRNGGGSDSAYADSRNDNYSIEEDPHQAHLVSEEFGESFLDARLDNEHAEREVFDGDRSVDLDLDVNAVPTTEGACNTDPHQAELDRQIQALESQSDAEGDILPFASSQLLLRGFDATPLGGRRTSQPASTLGQSVQEIEVAAARRLMGHW